MSAEDFAADALQAIEATAKAGERGRLRQIFVSRLEQPLEERDIEFDAAHPPDPPEWHTLEDLHAYANAPFRSPPAGTVRRGMATVITGDGGTAPIVASIDGMSRNIVESAVEANSTRVS